MAKRLTDCLDDAALIRLRIPHVTVAVAVVGRAVEPGLVGRTVGAQRTGAEAGDHFADAVLLTEPLEVGDRPVLPAGVERDGVGVDAGRADDGEGRDALDAVGTAFAGASL
jgi:hypothetical protein